MDTLNREENTTEGPDAANANAEPHRKAVGSWHRKAGFRTMLTAPDAPVDQGQNVSPADAILAEQALFDCI